MLLLVPRALVGNRLSICDAIRWLAIVRREQLVFVLCSAERS